MTRARKRQLWVACGLVLLLSLVFVLAFRSRPDGVAILRGAAGRVERDHQASVGAWEAARIGVTFALGDAVRTGPSSTATLELAGQHRLSLEPSTLLRFLAKQSDPKLARVELQAGELTFEAGGDALELETTLGTLHVDAHGQARLTKHGTTERLEVTIGSAEIQRDGKRWELEVGEAVEISGDQPLRRVPASELSAATPGAEPSPKAPAAPASGASASATPPEPVSAYPRGLERVDVAITAGESLVIHDPRPPTAVGVLAGQSCAGSALLTVDPGPRAKQRTGEARVGVELGRGAHRYFVQCLSGGTPGERVAQGTISILADSGLQKLAKTAPVTNLEADGRRYTVLYQSLLPRISIKWPNAPAAASYTLHITSPDGSKSLTANAASYSFAAGALAEGQHSLSFQASGARSRETSVVIRFDNAAPTASITSPADRSFAPGSSVLVSGMAQPGWVVSVAGETLAQDAQNRFSLSLQSPSEQALAIRFTQPRRGVHYYLRRSAAP